MNISDISHIYTGFLNKTLPEEEWTHEAHLITALSLLVDHGLEKAELIMPDMIRTFNLTHGGINSASEGYHHTITIFYLRVIEKFRLQNAADNLEDLVDLMLNSEIASPYFTLNYYSKNHLFTPEARLGYVEPDIKNY